PRAAGGRALAERPAVRDADPDRGAARVDPRKRHGRRAVLMSFFDAISIAASGLTAERVRMDVTSENLANADTTQGANGQPYQRQEVVLQQVGGGGFSAALSGAMSAAGGTSVGGNATPGGVAVAGIVNDPTPDQEVYDPGNPSANSQGYVKMPNVNPVNEM